MRSLVYGGGLYHLMDSGLEGQEPCMQPCKPTDAKQIWLGQDEDSRDQGRAGYLSGDDRHQPEHRLTVGDEIECSQFYGNEQQ